MKKEVLVVWIWSDEWVDGCIEDVEMVVSGYVMSEWEKEELRMEMLMEDVENWKKGRLWLVS